MTKKSYRVRNWGEYNKALTQRGSLTLWFDQETLSQWHAHKPTRQRGRPFAYSDAAIQCCLSLRTLFHLPLRATQGLIQSLFSLLQLPMSVPNYTTVCRRQQDLPIALSPRYSPREPLHLVIDSSGFKVYGEGEWMMRQHGKQKRRTWRKLHIGINPHTQDILISEVTSGSAHDAPIVPSLLAQLPTQQRLKQISGDGAYDAQSCYTLALEHHALPNFPPKRTAILHYPQKSPAQRCRNYAVMAVRTRGPTWWKRTTGYHQRSLAETAFSRLKGIFGDRVRSRCVSRQTTELLLRCRILNQFNRLGMPSSHPIHQ